MKRFNVEVKTDNGVQLVLSRTGDPQRTETVTVDTEELCAAVNAGVYSTPDEAKEDAHADVEFRSVKAAYELLGLPEGYRLTDDEISELRAAQTIAVDSLVPSVDTLFVQ